MLYVFPLNKQLEPAKSEDGAVVKPPPPVVVGESGMRGGSLRGGRRAARSSEAVSRTDSGQR